jgi:hypothetical protein
MRPPDIEKSSIRYIRPTEGSGNAVQRRSRILGRLHLETRAVLDKHKTITEADVFDDFVVLKVQR